MNDFYTHTTVPAFASLGVSALMRVEFDAVMAGFDKLPSLAGTALRPVRINAAGTALEASTSLDGVTIGAVTPGPGVFTTLFASAVASPTLAGHLVNKAYADALSFATVLPDQAANAGKEITTDGATASWGLTAPGALAILNYLNS